MKQLISPTKLIWICVILSTTFYSRSQSFEQGKLYVTVNNEDFILKKDNIGNLVSDIPVIDSLIMNFNISDFSMAFPLSPTLTDAYEVTCDCNENELQQKFIELSDYYSRPEKIPTIQLLAQPNDFSTEFTPDWALQLIEATGAWDQILCNGSPSVLIGITDSNYDWNHEELTGEYIYGDQSLTNGDINHGTAVAITASGATNNSVGKSSIGYNTKMNLYGMGYNNILQAANDGCKVINMSWASGCFYNSYYQQVITDVYNMGVFLVAAAGNGSSTCGDPTDLVYPAAFDHVFSVSSISSTDNHERTPGDPTTTHQHNNMVDLVAPGYDVPLGIAYNVYVTGNGSSFAAPFVAGTAALLLSIQTDLTPDRITDILKNSSDDIYSQNPGYIGQLGQGRLNASKAVENALIFSTFEVLYQDYLFGYNPVVTTNTCDYGESANTSTCDGSASIPSLAGYGNQLIYEWYNVDNPYPTALSGNSVTNLCPGQHIVSVTHTCLGFLGNFLFFVGTDLSDSDYDYPNGLEITSPSDQIEDLNNDEVIRIRGPLVFKSGVNYSFSNKTIEFASNNYNDPIIDLGLTSSGVIVEPGAKVSANNVTFKGLTSCNRMWEGIQVWGDDFNIVQNNGNSKNKNFNLLINTLKNGKLNLNSCIVQDAHIGVALYRTNMPFIANPPEYGRGLLHAKSTDFINNNVGVDFQSKNNVVNNSTILGCDFIANAALIETDVYGGLSSDVFIRLQGVREPLIAANTFNGMASSSIGERGTGIRSYGAGYLVESGNVGPINPNSPPSPNVFNDLDQGIDIYSFGGAVNTIRIKDNRFNNVYQGVTANGSNFDEISYNIFNIPAGDVNFNSWGLFLQTSSGFLATENSFNTSGTNNYTFGAVTRDVNLMNGELYKNTFNGDFSSATQAEGSANNQLQIDCNRYLGNNDFDWTVLSADLADQGLCGSNAEDAATNIFNPCSGANESNIFSVANFDYSTDPLLGPNCYSASVFIDPCTNPVVSYNNACPQIVTSPCPSCLIALGQQLDFTPPGLKRRKIKGELIRRLAQKGDVQQLVTVLTSEALPEDKKIIIPTRVKRKEFTEAREVMDNMEANTFEDQKFVELFDVLITLGETERELEDLTPAEKTIIENVAYSSTEVSVQAEAVLAELNKSRYIRFPQGLPTNTAMMTSSDEPEIITEEEQPLNVSVYPNPNQGEFVIEFEEAKDGVGYIVDPTGRKVKTLAFNENESSYEVTGLAHGIYTVLIQSVDGVAINKRILIK